jgi:predicted DNA-binding transcriptional regulator AlpA
MTARALTLTEVAAELGRSPSWLQSNWKKMVARHGMPAPVIEGGLLSWSAAQFYAWLDRDLPDELRPVAAAYRAALAAAADPASRISADENAAWRDHLDRKFARA